MLRAGRTGRRTLTAVLLVAGVMVASGCALIGGGDDVAENTLEPGEVALTHAAARAELDSIPGVEVSYVALGTLNGLPWGKDLTTGLNLEDAYPDELITPLADYMLALVWSVPEKKPGAMSIGFLRLGEGVDLVPTAESFGWTTGYTSPGLDLAVQDVEDRYGEWPGERPQLPPELANYVPTMLPTTPPSTLTSTPPAPSPTP
ncbi:hypothetical protein B0I08_10991 [Glaciihabitans tibetensis]|uniref:Uncharacterized protein n=2 Tax=Glaciihabitans tibetensis TaxID=1266600 RepID=A0A2T0V714_9MICO|nr:hypothetical protein B0I08_10991 [Glaciihabitans tibetensis]